MEINLHSRREERNSLLDAVGLLVGSLWLGVSGKELVPYGKPLARSTGSSGKFCYFQTGDLVERELFRHSDDATTAFAEMKPLRLLIDERAMAHIAGKRGRF